MQTAAAGRTQPRRRLTRQQRQQREQALARQGAAGKGGAEAERFVDPCDSMSWWSYYPRWENKLCLKRASEGLVAQGLPSPQHPHARAPQRLPAPPPTPARRFAPRARRQYGGLSLGSLACAHTVIGYDQEARVWALCQCLCSTALKFALSP